MADTGSAWVKSGKGGQPPLKPGFAAASNVDGHASFSFGSSPLLSRIRSGKPVSLSTSIPVSETALDETVVDIEPVEEDAEGEMETIETKLSSSRGKRASAFVLARQERAQTQSINVESATAVLAQLATNIDFSAPSAAKTNSNSEFQRTLGPAGKLQGAGGELASWQQQEANILKQKMKERSELAKRRRGKVLSAIEVKRQQQVNEDNEPQDSKARLKSMFAGRQRQGPHSVARDQTTTSQSDSSAENSVQINNNNLINSNSIKNSTQSPTSLSMRKISEDSSLGQKLLFRGNVKDEMQDKDFMGWEDSDMEGLQIQNARKNRPTESAAAKAKREMESFLSGIRNSRAAADEKVAEEKRGLEQQALEEANRNHRILIARRFRAAMWAVIASVRLAHCVGKSLLQSNSKGDNDNISVLFSNWDPTLVLQTKQHQGPENAMGAGDALGFAPTSNIRFHCFTSLKQFQVQKHSFVYDGCDYASVRRMVMPIIPLNRTRLEQGSFSNANATTLKKGFSGGLARAPQIMPKPAGSLIFSLHRAPNVGSNRCSSNGVKEFELRINMQCFRPPSSVFLLAQPIVIDAESRSAALQDAQNSAPDHKLPSSITNIVLHLYHLAQDAGECLAALDVSRLSKWHMEQLRSVQDSTGQKTPTSTSSGIDSLWPAPASVSCVTSSSIVATCDKYHDRYARTNVAASVLHCLVNCEVSSSPFFLNRNFSGSLPSLKVRELMKSCFSHLALNLPNPSKPQKVGEDSANKTMATEGDIQLNDCTHIPSGIARPISEAALNRLLRLTQHCGSVSQATHQYKHLLINVISDILKKPWMVVQPDYSVRVEDPSAANESKRTQSTIGDGIIQNDRPELSCAVPMIALQPDVIDQLMLMFGFPAAETAVQVELQLQHTLADASFCHLTTQAAAHRLFGVISRIFTERNDVPIRATSSLSGFSTVMGLPVSPSSTLVQQIKLSATANRRIPSSPRSPKAKAGKVFPRRGEQSEGPKKDLECESTNQHDLSRDQVEKSAKKIVKGENLLEYLESTILKLLRPPKPQTRVIDPSLSIVSLSPFAVEDGSVDASNLDATVLPAPLNSYDLAKQPGSSLPPIDQNSNTTGKKNSMEHKAAMPLSEGRHVASLVPEGVDVNSFPSHEPDSLPSVVGSTNSFLDFGAHIAGGVSSSGVPQSVQFHQPVSSVQSAISTSLRASSGVSMSPLVSRTLSKVDLDLSDIPVSLRTSNWTTASNLHQLSARGEIVKFPDPEIVEPRASDMSSYVQELSKSSPHTQHPHTQYHQNVVKHVSTAILGNFQRHLPILPPSKQPPVLNAPLLPPSPPTKPHGKTQSIRLERAERGGKFSNLGYNGEQQLLVDPAEGEKRDGHQHPWALAGRSRGLQVQLSQRQRLLKSALNQAVQGGHFQFSNKDHA